MRVKIINNPSSGRRIVQKSLESIVGKLVLEGIFRKVDKFDTKKKYDGMYEVMSIKKGQYDLIIAVGGDGTLNEVVNGLIKAKLNIPLAIIPAGTVNDFANYLSIPNDVNGICSMFRNGNPIPIDVCKVNNNYFINVAASGLLTEVAIKASIQSKTVFGKFAYYAEGIKEIPKKLFKSVRFQFQYNDKVFEDNVLLFAVLNSSSAGGFKKFAPNAGLSDGKFDVIIFKKSDIFDAATIFLKVIRGDHINEEGVTYFQTDKFSVKCLDDNDIAIDIDGEKGGGFPASFEIIPSGIDIFIPDYSKLKSNRFIL